MNSQHGVILITDNGSYVKQNLVSGHTGERLELTLTEDLNEANVFPPHYVLSREFEALAEEFKIKFVSLPAFSVRSVHIKVNGED